MASQELIALREMLARRPPMTRPIDERRLGFEQLCARFPLPGDVVVEAGELGGVSGKWVSTPAARPGRAVLYLHGGAFVIGSSTSYRELAARLGRAAQAAVFVPDYRLAPEHPFPAGQDDCLAVYRAMIEKFPAASLALAGDSCGVTLAVAVLMRARDEGRAMPSALGGISGYLDLTHSQPSIRERAHLDPFIDVTTMPYAVGLYAPQADTGDWRVSPFFGDPTGLPPMLLQVGEHEVLHDDSVLFAQKARACGVAAEAEVWPEMIHVWHLFGPLLSEGRAATDVLGRWLGARLDPAAAA